MFRSVNELYNYTLSAQDGEIGRCKDFLFDDEFWTIRYMVVDTRKWLPGRRVLISPNSLGEPDWRQKIFPIGMTRDQIKEAPGEEEDVPVTRQYERRLAGYYGYYPYWDGPYMWGPIERPRVPADAEMIAPQLSQLERNQKEEEKDYDTHLRSSKEVIGYHIHATDGRIGHVDDFILDDDTWTLRYLVVDTRNWLPGRKVLITPLWVKLVEWFDQKVQTNLKVEEIKNSPPYDPAAPVNRQYEERLYDFYGRPKYWS